MQRIARANGGREVLFLGYDAAQTPLIGDLAAAGHGVTHTAAPITSLAGFDVGVSFGYRHILRPSVLRTGRVVNLHISLLPWNRGAHPNFWAHMDGTPSGVTIHEVDDGLDTGPVLFQRPVSFDPDETTFQTTQTRLIAEIEDLFRGKMDAIIHGEVTPTPQQDHGSSHRAADLPAEFAGWNTEIIPEIERLKGLRRGQGTRGFETP